MGGRGMVLQRREVLEQELETPKTEYAEFGQKIKLAEKNPSRCANTRNP
jgi:hypothetical protein